MFSTPSIEVLDIDNVPLAVGDRILHFGGTRGTWYGFCRIVELRPDKEMQLVVVDLPNEGRPHPIRNRYVLKAVKQND